jgi:hypothetical protein
MSLARIRRRFQFRLRTLFVVATVVAVQCATCLPMFREWQQREQHEANRTQIFSFFVGLAR